MTNYINYLMRVFTSLCKLPKIDFGKKMNDLSDSSVRSFIKTKDGYFITNYTDYYDKDCQPTIARYKKIMQSDK